MAKAVNVETTLFIYKYEYRDAKHDLAVAGITAVLVSVGEVVLVTARNLSNQGRLSMHACVELGIKSIQHVAQAKSQVGMRNQADNTINLVCGTYRPCRYLQTTA